MKKLFALLLAATMLLCAIPFVASADDTAAATAPVEVDGLDDFYWVKGSGTEADPYALTNALGGETDIKLTADITFGDDTIVALKKVVKNTETDEYEFVYTDETKTTIATYEWTFKDLNRGLLDGGYTGTFDGDGHSIVYTGNYVMTGSAGFLSNSSLAGDVKNLTIGSAEHPLQYTNKHANIGVLGSQNQVRKSVIENVVIYANVTGARKGSSNIGMFFGKTTSGVTFNNCRAYGSLELTAQDTNGYVIKMGGFVGSHVCAQGDTAPIYFNACYSDVDIKTNGAKANSGAGGLLGFLDCTNGDATMYATNSIAVGDLPSDNPSIVIGAGRLVGCIDKEVAPEATLTVFENCNKLVETAEGASIKIDDATIRFRAIVAGYQGYVDTYGAANVKAGIIYAEKATAETLAENFKIDADGVTEVIATQVEDGNVYATIATPSATAYGTEYTVRGYIAYTTDGGTTWTVTYAETALTRSVSYVASAAIADLADAKGNGYGFATEGGKYSKFTAAQLTKLATYVVPSAS